MLEAAGELMVVVLPIADVDGDPARDDVEEVVFPNGAVEIAREVGSADSVSVEDTARDEE